MNKIRLVGSWQYCTDDAHCTPFVLGFQFTEGEPSALIQTSGGPCAVIAPVQAYILKNLLFTQRTSSENTVNLRNVTGEELIHYIVHVMMY